MNKERLKLEIERDFRAWWIGDGELSDLEETVLSTVDKFFDVDEKEVAE